MLSFHSRHTLRPIPQIRFLVLPIPMGIVVDALDFGFCNFTLYFCGYAHNQTARRNNRTFGNDGAGGNNRL